MKASRKQSEMQTLQFQGLCAFREPMHTVVAHLARARDAGFRGLAKPYRGWKVTQFTSGTAPRALGPSFVC